MEEYDDKDDKEEIKYDDDDNIEYDDDPVETTADQNIELSIVEKNYYQWSSINGSKFLPTGKTIKILTPGLYDVFFDNRSQKYGLNKIEFTTDELYKLYDKETESILHEIQKFWSSKEIYKKYKLIYKRGILLHGEPGCGKSGIIQLCTEHLIRELKGIVINIKNAAMIEGFLKIIPNLRQIEPNRPLIVILEDIDSIITDDKYVTSQILNILDGITQYNNIVYIASTNYPEKLADRITNRPGRFDKRYHISLPSKEVRLEYLKRKIKDEKIDIKKWVLDTEDMSLSHIKELLISVLIVGTPYDDAIEYLKSLKIRPTNKPSSGLGFNN